VRRRRSHRSPLPLIVGLLFLGVFATAIGVGQFVGFPDLSWSAHHGDDGLKPSAPTRISIPALGVRAEVVQVGQADDGSIATPVEDPAGTAGWYGLGPSPGEDGTAVIVGHVDTASKPAVFGKLGELSAGKLVEVKRKDRRVATFTVDSVERFPKTSFPADRVFAGAGGPRLVLVTCGGEWVGGHLGYADNVIVFAHLA
jgi:Sortase domain